MHTKIADVEVLFLAKRSIFAYSMSPIFWKLLVWQLNWYIWGPSMCILWPVIMFITLWEWTGSISRNLVVTKSLWILDPSHHTVNIEIFQDYMATRTIEMVMWTLQQINTSKLEVWNPGFWHSMLTFLETGTTRVCKNPPQATQHEYEEHLQQIWI